MIYDSEEGFDMRFSRDGMWGRANYFADKSIYSNKYAYKGEGMITSRQMFMATVIIGKYETINADKTLVVPNLLPGSTTQRYDSV